MPATMTRRELPSAVTILTLGVLIHVANMPHLFFKLVGSPLETSALCSLIHHLSRLSHKLASEKSTSRAINAMNALKVTNTQNKNKNLSEETSNKTLELSTNDTELLAQSHSPSHSCKSELPALHQEETQYSVIDNKEESTMSAPLHQENCQLLGMPESAQEAIEVESKDNTIDENKSVNKEMSNTDEESKSDNNDSENDADYLSRYDSLSAIATDTDNTPEWRPPNLFRNISVNKSALDENVETNSHVIDVQQQQEEKEDMEKEHHEEEEEKKSNEENGKSQVESAEKLVSLQHFHDLNDAMEISEDKTATPPDVALTAVRHTSRESSTIDAGDQCESEMHRNARSTETEHNTVTNCNLTLENEDNESTNNNIVLKRNVLSNTSLTDNTVSLPRAESSEILDEEIMQKQQEQQQEELLKESEVEEEVESTEEMLPEELVQSYRMSRMPSSEQLSSNSLCPHENAIKFKNEVATNIITTSEEVSQMQQHNEKSLPDSKADEHENTEGLYENSNNNNYNNNDNESEFRRVDSATVQVSVDEFVIAHINTFLKALISSSLHVMPLPNWIGGLSYGSCGGLLFQTLLMTSSRATGNNTMASATLIRFFLDQVAYSVRIECANSTEQSTLASHTQEQLNLKQRNRSKRKSELDSSSHNKDNIHYHHHRYFKNDHDDDEEEEKTGYDDDNGESSDISKWQDHANALLSPSTSSLSVHSH